MFLNEMNVQWMFAEQSRENECSWIKNVRKIQLTTSHIVFEFTNCKNEFFLFIISLLYIMMKILK